MSSQLSFLGAVGTVTGSRHLLETRGRRLLVDCGLFQGPKALRERNWDGFPVEPGSIDAVILTHAHIDHIGYLPRLLRDGFSGPVYGTDATLELARILLEDTAHLQEEEARWANKRGYSKHSPAKPLFTRQDAQRVFPRFHPVHYGEHFEVADGVRAKYHDAGHILGSAMLDLKSSGKGGKSRKLLFGGDLGRPADVMLRPPSQVYNVDFMVMESTYGNRRHGGGDGPSALAEEIRAAHKRGGLLMIPAFSVGRAQALLYQIRELEAQGEIPEMPVLLDSPMANAALEVHRNHIRELNLTCRRQHLEGIDLFAPARLRLIVKQEDSKRAMRTPGPAVVITGSGMVTGGRILHYFFNHLGNPDNTALFIGYQAEGTRGRALCEGSERLKMFGTEVPVRARVARIEGFSGHADYLEMMAWLLAFNRRPEKVFLVHGEDASAGGLRDHLQETLGWEATLPRDGQSFEIDF